MGGETMVLNAGYEPIGRTSWKRAIRLLFRGSAEVIEEYPDRWVTYTIKMPCIVRLVNFFMGNYKRPKFSRENVFVRDHQRCQYCGRKVTRDEMTYDHVVPRSQGGATEWSNVVTSCLGCNQRKANRTPRQAGMKLIADPVRPQSLPLTTQFAFKHEEGMPPQWAQMLRDLGYWHGTLT